MSAYVIVLREGPIRDAAEMAEYQRKVEAIVPDPSIRPLAVYGAVEALEGRAPDGVAILEFPDAETARRWRLESGYADAAGHRLKAADHRMILVEGL